MKIAENSFVTLTYELTVDGEIVDRATTERPLEFIYAAGFLLPAFESEIKDMKSGDKFKFTLTADNGYGKVVPEAVIDLPKSAFVVDGEVDQDMLAVGNRIPMMDNQGNQMVGVVVSVGDDTVSMDFNHPLAGKELHFAGVIEGVRETTDVDRAKFMGMGGGCGCGCGDSDCDCGDGCDCDSQSSCGCGCGN